MAPPKKIDGDDLANLLARATDEPAFQDRLINSPDAVLDELNLGDKAVWGPYFHKLKPENFDSEITEKISSDPTGEAEARA